MGRAKLKEEEKRVYKTFTLSRDTIDALDRMKTGRRSSGVLIDDAIKMLDMLEVSSTEDDSYYFFLSLLSVCTKAKQVAENCGKGRNNWKSVAVEGLELYQEKHARAERRKEKAEEQKKAEAKSRRGRKKAVSADAVQ